MLYTPSRNQSVDFDTTTAPVTATQYIPENTESQGFLDGGQQYSPTLTEGNYRRSPGQLAMDIAWLNTWPLLAFVLAGMVVFNVMGANSDLMVIVLFAIVPLLFMRMLFRYGAASEGMKRLYVLG